VPIVPLALTMMPLEELLKKLLGILLLHEGPVVTARRTQQSACTNALAKD
jgi:hypothetical protein